MKTNSILLSIIFLFFTIISCNQQEDLITLESIDPELPIEENNKINIDLSSFTKQEIEKSSCGEVIVNTLYAGQNIDIGKIIISNDAKNLYVTYDVRNSNWWLDETHLNVGPKNEIPINGGNNPVIGQFNHPGNHDLTQQYTFTIPLEEINSDSYDDDRKCFTITAHAAVVKKENGEIISSETAFGNGEKFKGNRWGWYYNYCEQKCEEMDCYDAFAKSSNAFCFNFDDFYGNTHWAWTNEFNGNDFPETSTFKMPIYVKVGQGCETGDDSKIGYVSIQQTKKNSVINMSIKYVITNKDYILNEAILYHGSEKNPLDNYGIPKSNITRENFNRESLEIVTREYLFDEIIWDMNVKGNIFYLIPYANVCKIEVIEH